MDSEISVSARHRERGRSDVPYAPSVVDRFMAWADRLPGPVWAFYLAVLAVLIVIVNGVTWLDGSAPFSTFGLYRSSLPCYPVFVLALMHYLNRLARRALAAFRPALGASDAEYARFEYELTTSPPGKTWGAHGVASLITTREVLARIPTWPWETGTLAGFISVFLLPIIGLFIELLERFLF